MIDRDLLVSKEIPLSRYSTLGIGGAARFFTEVVTIEEMRQALLFAKEKQLPFFILGKGSNCLFDDRGFNGLVIHNKIDFIHHPAPHLFHVGAGYSFSLLGAQTARQQWAGLQFASGIPCSVGGAVFMNAGANGQETFDCLYSVDFMDQEGECHTFYKEELAYGYRLSSFHELKGAIVAATFSLNPSQEARQEQLAIIDYRKKTQPYHEKSAGCVFRNPEGGHAGALIEQCGLKGIVKGSVKVSSMHANFLINDASATAADFLSLIQEVQKEVKEKAGVHLEPEVRVIPYEGEGSNGISR